MNSQRAQELRQINKNKFKSKPNHTTNVPFAWKIFFTWRLFSLKEFGIFFLKIVKNC
jgi:hypothetical protein